MGVKHLIHLVATSAIGATWRRMWIGAGSTSMVGAPGGEKVRFWSGAYLIFVTGTTGGARGEKNCHVEKFVHVTDFQVEKFAT